MGTYRGLKDHNFPLISKNERMHDLQSFGEGRIHSVNSSSTRERPTDTIIGRKTKDMIFGKTIRLSW